MAQQVENTRGLHDLGDGCYAWLEPPGSWGFSNSGVVVADDEVLVVDTQNDMRMAAELRGAVEQLSPGRPVSTVVNTHADGDHWNGNLFYEGARIVASVASVADMRSSWLDPADLPKLANDETALGRFFKWRDQMFDYADWRPVYPTESFTGDMTLALGGAPIELAEVGPAHTDGDVVVHVPSSGVVFAGDVLFVDSTPIVWAGPLSKSVAACDRILGYDPRLIVPGHGPVIEVSGVATVREYFAFILDYATGRYEAGDPPEQAYAEIELGPYKAWPHASRAFQNIVTVYRERDPGRFAYARPQVLETVLRDDHGDWQSLSPCTHDH